MGTLKGDPSSPTLAECKAREQWGETQLGECLGLAGAPVHGQGVSWQLPSPQHKVPVGWLGDVTVMLSQSCEIFPGLMFSFPTNPHCEMPRSLSAWSAYVWMGTHSPHNGTAISLAPTDN